MHATLGAALSVLSLLVAPAASAQEEEAPALDLGVVYRADLMGIGADGRRLRGFALDDLNVQADGDLEQLAGWGGARFHIGVLNNLGGRPNDVARTLQGVDNFEVAGPRLRLYQAWIEQKLGSATTMRAGLYDLNSEFYANEAAGLLIGPAFGMGSEIASTGPNGPSIFPMTALAVRVEQRFGGAGFARVALLNAAAGALGGERGSALDFDHGALLIGEAGLEKGGDKVAFGAWGYSARQDDIAGTSARHPARGGYMVAQKALGDQDGRFATRIFVRAGISDGRTSPFKGGWQAGVLATRVLPGREDSRLSIGAHQAYLSDGYRGVLRADGRRAARTESALELTFSDRLTDFLTLQPDVQLVWNRSGEADAALVTVLALRTTLEF
jgi:porin